MAKKSLGYVQLQWTCPNCSTKNPGPQKTCLGCGMPQPENVEFEQAAQEQIITDAAVIAQAKAGPDVHCRYCGSRNSAAATTCSQCGANLAEGEKRESGEVLGAHRDKVAGPIVCPACGAENDPSAPKCAQCGASLVAPKPAPPPPPLPKTLAGKKRGGLFGGIGLVMVVLLLCAGAITCVVLLNRSESLTGTATSASWERKVIIEQLLPVTRQAWRDELPMGTIPQQCQPKLRRVQDNPAANTKEVCGTPYTVDSGTGYGEVVQDCKYEVYEDYCEYRAEEWQRADPIMLDGNNFSPQWPQLALTANQREAGREEQYTCYFNTESGEYDYSSSDPGLLTQCQPGSRWLLEVNTFGGVIDIRPAN